MGEFKLLGKVGQMDWKELCEDDFVKKLKDTFDLNHFFLRIDEYFMERHLQTWTEYDLRYSYYNPNTLVLVNRTVKANKQTTTNIERAVVVPVPRFKELTTHEICEKLASGYENAARVGAGTDRYDYTAIIDADNKNISQQPGGQHTRKTSVYTLEFETSPVPNQKERIMGIFKAIQTIDMNINIKTTSILEKTAQGLAKKCKNGPPPSTPANTSLFSNARMRGGVIDFSIIGIARDLAAESKAEARVYSEELDQRVADIHVFEHSNSVNVGKAAEYPAYDLRELIKLGKMLVK